MARRVRVKDFYPESIELEMPDGEVYEIEALDVDEMIQLFETERVLAGEVEEGAEPRGPLDGLAQANTIVVDIIRKRFPDREIPAYRLPPQAIGGVFATLAGAETVADAVREALVDAEAATPETGAGAGEDAPLNGAAEPEAAGDPLRSTKLSPTPSSDSERTTTGPQNGGADQAAPGPPSAPTSATLVERAAH